MINIDTGVSIIMNNWLKVKRDELIHFITDETHMREAQAVSRWANGADAILKLTILPSQLIQKGEIIENMVNILSNEDVIIGATDHSFITSVAIKTAISRGARFLSLPLQCNDGTSLLENDFIQMNPKDVLKDARYLVKKLDKAETVRVTTKLGTDLTLSIKDRKAGYFNGCATHRGDKGSASFEAFIAPQEDSMEGVLYLDGSFGYIGTVKSPIKVTFRKGAIVSAESEDEGAETLLSYIESFKDRTMFKAGEFGIGLNRLSKCRGICYIEDESMYTTFHIGMGRNISLGGTQNANGHFDIVTHRPTIYADGCLIMKDGEITFNR